jgi:hypothetical protein
MLVLKQSLDASGFGMRSRIVLAKDRFAFSRPLSLAARTLLVRCDKRPVLTGAVIASNQRYGLSRPVMMMGPAMVPEAGGLQAPANRE